MTLYREDLRKMLEEYKKGNLNKKDLSNWAFDRFKNDMEFADSLVDEIMLNLVSLHDVGWVFQQYRPDENKLDAYYNRLNE